MQIFKSYKHLSANVIETQILSFLIHDRNSIHSVSQKLVTIMSLVSLEETAKINLFCMSQYVSPLRKKPK